MTNSQPDVLTANNQLPPVSHVPLFLSTAAQDAIDLAYVAGLDLDAWQQHILEGALGERADGKWSAFEVGLVLPRQNGKNAVLEARELAGLYLFKEELIIHSAHEFKTSQEAFLKILQRIKATPDLLEQVAGFQGDPDAQMTGIKTAHGAEGITLKNGNRLRFAARSGGSGRGFTGDCIIFDEAFALVQAEMAAMLPTMAAKSITGNPQLWYTSSAGMPNSDVLAKLQSRAKTGTKAERLAYYEWSVPGWDELPDEIRAIYLSEDQYIEDPATHRAANPAYEIRISQEFIHQERGAMGDEEFKRERLGIWAKLGGESDLPEWAGAADVNSMPGLTTLAVGIDVPPSRDSAAITVASIREDGKMHLELIKEEEGTDWVPEFLRGFKERRNPIGFFVIEGSAAEALAPECKRMGIRLQLVPFRKYAAACGTLVDELKARRAFHRGQKAMADAVKSARKKTYGDTLFYWNRKSNGASITPLVSLTVAVYGLQTKGLRSQSGTKSGRVLVL